MKNTILIHTKAGKKHFFDDSLDFKHAIDVSADEYSPRCELAYETAPGKLEKVFIEEDAEVVWEQVQYQRVAKV